MTLDLSKPSDIRRARYRLGLTHGQLARALRLEGLHAADTIRKWENGAKPISGPARVAIELMLERAGRL